MAPWILLILGFLLILIEFYLPGAIMGISGGVLVFVSIILFGMQTKSLLAIIAYVVGVGIGLILLIKFALWKIRTAKPERSIYSDNAQNGFVA
jgi:membrane protein implicated in regulation of membrane protease activity